MLTISLLFNIVTLYNICRRKTDLITLTYGRTNNISEYLNRIENAVINEDSNDLRLNLQGLRYECGLIDNSLNELSTLYAPIYKPTLVNNFSAFYSNELTNAIVTQNIEQIQEYTKICENLHQKLETIQTTKNVSIFYLITAYNTTLKLLSQSN